MWDVYRASSSPMTMQVEHEEYPHESIIHAKTLSTTQLDVAPYLVVLR